jgi:hypothetical protein
MKSLDPPGFLTRLMPEFKECRSRLQLCQNLIIESFVNSLLDAELYL